jgi:hypothetical protein
MLLVFLSGMISGVLLFITYGIYKMRKLEKMKEDLLGKLETKAKDLKGQQSIIERLRAASEIAQQQLDLRDAAQQPSKNATHSRYKNGLISELQELEQQKVAILQSILNDGFDPKITVLNSAGEREEMPLSEFLQVESAKSAEASPKEAPKQVGRFTVIKGGRDDGSNQ